jgi:hypothetical protein
VRYRSLHATRQFRKLHALRLLKTATEPNPQITIEAGSSEVATFYLLILIYSSSSSSIKYQRSKRPFSLLLATIDFVTEFPPRATIWRSIFGKTNQALIICLDRCSQLMRRESAGLRSTRAWARLRERFPPLFCSMEFSQHPCFVLWSFRDKTGRDPP